MVYRLENPQAIAKLFEGWEETMIWSCLQQVMGDIYADDRDHPTAAKAVVGCFAFLAGRPNPELILHTTGAYTILTPRTEEWALLIEECLGEKAKPAMRYAILKEKDVFNPAVLHAYVNALPKEYELKNMDEALYQRCQKEGWSRDFVSQFSSYELFETYGQGVLALKEGEMVAGASAYSAYKGGIEVEVDTKPEYRRQGLATACSAQLILNCLEKGLYPSWDAANLWSVALAEKLGYHRGEPYMIYTLNNQLNPPDRAVFECEK